MFTNKDNTDIIAPRAVHLSEMYNQNSKILFKINTKNEQTENDDILKAQIHSHTLASQYDAIVFYWNRNSLIHYYIRKALFSDFI